jgi:3-deoxy-D-manno-octulosonic-acid transferase
MRTSHPGRKLMLTFFSPSGYEVRKNFEGVEGVFYLPLDTSRDAKDFLDILQPSVVLVVKYEYWPNYFFACKQRGIPLYMVSAILRPNQRFFGWMGGFWRNVLRCVSHFFVQNEESLKLLHTIGIDCVTLTGDTRFDRVIQSKENAQQLPMLHSFSVGHNLLVAGSTWSADESALEQWFAQCTPGWKLVLVPHEVGEGHIHEIMQRFPTAARWSEASADSVSAASVLVIDTIGVLTAAYSYADVCWIGGGFGAGIHNTLEAAVWGKPILFGPHYEKFDEARCLLACGAAKSAANAPDLVAILNDLTSNEGAIRSMGKAAGLFVQQGRGATDKILSHLELK